MLNISTLLRSVASTYACDSSCETISWFGTKFPWPRLNDVAVPALAVEAHPTGARATRNRSIAGGSKARMLVIVVAVPAVGGSARLGASLARASIEKGTAGSTTLLINAGTRPQVL